MGNLPSVSEATATPATNWPPDGLLPYGFRPAQQPAHISSNQLELGVKFAGDGRTELVDGTPASLHLRRNVRQSTANPMFLVTGQAVRRRFITHNCFPRGKTLKTR